MQEILLHINSVEGVIGSAVFSERGDLLGHAFPPLIDTATLKKVATLSVECLHGLQITQNMDLLDLRYADGRLIVKSFSGALLCLLCAKNINLQVLNITLNLAVKKLEARLPAADDSTAPPAAPEPAAVESNDGILRLRISHLADKKASSSFDSLGMIALSQPTSQYINDFYKTAFKKLTLANPAAGTSGTFPVMVMKDMDPAFDGSIIVGPGIEKKLKAVEGEKVDIRIG